MKMLYSENNSEQKLVKLLKDRKASAMKDFYSLYAEYLTAVGSRYIVIEEDLKDVLQNAFIKIFTSIDQFEYRDKGSLKAWASRIVVNEALKWIQQNERSVSLDEEWEVPDNSENLHGGSFGENTGEDFGESPDTGDLPAEVIQEMIRKLPIGYRTVFNLYVFENKSHKEIATLLHIKEATSASQFHRAKNLLAKQIKQYQSGSNGRTMDQ